VDLNGMRSGRLGVGFDITGNFGSNAYSSSGFNDKVQNSITLRSSYASDFNIITRTSNLNSQTFSKNINLYQQILGNEIPIFKRVRVRLTDFGQRVVVDMKAVGDLNFTNYLNYNFTNYNNSLLSSTHVTVNNIPLSSTSVSFTPTVQCGLSFSTGENSNTIFKIRNFNINGVFSNIISQGTYTYDPDNTTLIASQNYRYTLAPYFFEGDAMAIQNTYDGVLNHTFTGSFSTTNPAITGTPLIITTANSINNGAPYQAGDKFVGITQRT